MDTVNRVQILDEAVCISSSAKNLGKGMHPSILLQASGKIDGQNGLFNIGMGTGQRKEKLLI